MDNIELKEMVQTVNNGLCTANCYECKENEYCELFRYARQLLSAGYRKEKYVAKRIANGLEGYYKDLVVKGEDNTAFPLKALMLKALIMRLSNERTDFYDKLKSKITLSMPLTDREKAYAVLYMGYDLKDLK